MEQIRWSNEIDAVLCIGQSLVEIGVDNWGLSKEMSTKAIDSLVSMGISVLGGDVYIDLNGHMEATGDNWFCERYANETDSGFLVRSAETAKQYIRAYPELGRAVYFAIVPGI